MNLIIPAILFTDKEKVFQPVIKKNKAYTNILKETLLERLLEWAEHADYHPLNVYSLVLLGAAAEYVDEDWSRSIEERARLLIPVVLRRLHQIRRSFSDSAASTSADSPLAGTPPTDLNESTGFHLSPFLLHIH